MTEQTYGIADALMGGPGLDGYAYNADVYCIRDGQDLIRNIFRIGTRLDELTFNDSERVPQPIFFGESDHPEHCARCGELLPTSVIEQS